MQAIADVLTVEEWSKVRCRGVEEEGGAGKEVWSNVSHKGVEEGGRGGALRKSGARYGMERVSCMKGKGHGVLRERERSWRPV
eukprot:350844-Chlamydomonas_euryale.AAC.7